VGPRQACGLFEEMSENASVRLADGGPFEHGVLDGRA